MVEWNESTFYVIEWNASVKSCGNVTAENISLRYGAGMLVSFPDVLPLQEVVGAGN